MNINQLKNAKKTEVLTGEGHSKPALSVALGGQFFRVVPDRAINIFIDQTSKLQQVVFNKGLHYVAICITLFHTAKEKRMKDFDGKVAFITGTASGETPYKYIGILHLSRLDEFWWKDASSLKFNDLMKKWQSMVSNYHILIGQEIY